MANLSRDSPEWTNSFIDRTLLRSNKMILEMISEAEKAAESKGMEKGLKEELKRN